MKRFEVEVAKFRKINVVAPSKQEAEDIVAVMDDEELEMKSNSSDGNGQYVIWGTVEK
jgi:hypothetical protein